MLNESENHFLEWDGDSSEELDDPSELFLSLVTMVKAGVHFDSSLEEKARSFIHFVTPTCATRSEVYVIMQQLTPSADYSSEPSIDNCFVLLSSPNEGIVQATLSLLTHLACLASRSLRYAMMAHYRVISRVMDVVTPHLIPFSSSEDLHGNVLQLLTACFRIASYSSLYSRETVTDDEMEDCRETVYDEGIAPSVAYLDFICRNRSLFAFSEYSDDYMEFLVTLIDLALFEDKTHLTVSKLPISHVLISLFDFAEDRFIISEALSTIFSAFHNAGQNDRRTIERSKQVTRTLSEEGFCDFLHPFLIRSSDSAAVQRLTVCLTI
ncbi:hypothetical protein BLNAU_17886 [Blattamonas nauphoetae]|uniref:SPIN90/Ldb17 leucine-rich domain-containing protein n=1 Tax=Blattamonas nauphoetae TaxID=2049346 RepID=A0ABQ9X5X4_9EUKA|nr:hypothetical protein BLNAU_17886 [Blattamonas nauphoetae]